MNNISTRLKFERTKRNLTQREISLILNMSQGQYNRIENGLGELTNSKLELLHLKLGVDLNYLLTGKYSKLDFGLDKMDFQDLKKLNSEIFKELESRLAVNPTAQKLHKNQQ
ncbi:Helix-turn-helix domain [Weeksella virosa]|uniref:Helix-turn-helix domain protein n=1 Tax=Weeksella virosa (strain ATCC 43766 / DSM 16922 / JCM 21250 / CCUG 30538 / CDC 9751 / IAM 14551 / NBRC 16016 / NCTC 11634 / CL345/78) TaxID=865938 RepID=F0NY15_WEEVC|nr:helix-turn-helix transcriptional regulator [Weeksella virosa]ADX67006.1 helix-turn-helix domain protein [Weeksella virosa DSM 16922]SUP53272.1 Helix-turn-helix domain [Weeksella virosa]VEH63264.1 Helix-turn-helix domain [Weeksella virosa]